MTDILMMATLIAPVTSGLVEVVKRVGIKNSFIPVISLIIGILLGAAAFSFTELVFVERLWAGGISGLAAVGFFELAKEQARKNDRKDDVS